MKIFSRKLWLVIIPVLILGWGWAGSGCNEASSLNVPANLQATAVSSSEIDLSWTDNSNNEDGFKIERKTGAKGIWEYLGSVTANVVSCSDTGLTPNAAYYYRVYSYNSSGSSGYSNEANVALPACPVTAPTAPSNLTATVVSSTEINLSWTDNSNDEDGFKIERKAGAGGTYVQVGTVGVGVTSYQDSGLDGNTKYYYQVYAYSCAGSSDYSNEESKIINGLGACEEAIASGVAADIIANCDSTQLTAQENSNAGLKLISLNSGSDAKSFLSAVPSADPFYGEAQYGIMLADLQSLTKDVDSLLGMILSLTSMTSYEPHLSIASYDPQASSGVDLWSMLGSMIIPIEDKLKTLDTEAAAVIANGYTISTDATLFTKIPLIMGTSGGQYYITVDFKGKAGNLEARAIKTIANLSIALIEAMAAHDLTIDLTSAMNNLSGLMDMLTSLTNGNSSSVDLVKSLRGLGWLLADNPNFLTKSSTRWSANMADVPARFTAAIEAFRNLDSDIIAVHETTADACKSHVACLVSSDAAINAGDQLLINAVVHVEIKYALSAAVVNTINSLAGALSTIAGITLTATTAGATVDVDLTNGPIVALTPLLMDPLVRIIPSLDDLLVQVESSITTGAAITPDNINPLLAALFEADGSNAPQIPTGLWSLSVKPLFAMPLRQLTTTFKCNTTTTMPGTGGNCLAIEVESSTACLFTNTACTQGDTIHFAGMTEIAQIGADGMAPVDCVAVSGTTKMPLVPTKGTIYVALGDPSLNGALLMNPSKLPAPYADTTHTTLVAADNYALWKELNWVIVSYAGDIEATTLGKQIRTYIDLVGGAVPAGTVPSLLNCGAFK